MLLREGDSGASMSRVRSIKYFRNLIFDVDILMNLAGSLNELS